jgi:hypothetical protein
MFAARGAYAPIAGGSENPQKNLLEFAVNYERNLQPRLNRQDQPQRLHRGTATRQFSENCRSHIRRSFITVADSPR